MTRRRQTKSAKGSLKPIARASQSLRPSKLARPESKRAVINLRVSKAEKAEIKRNAQRLGLSVSEYLLQTHRHAHPQLSSGNDPAATANTNVGRTQDSWPRTPRMTQIHRGLRARSLRAPMRRGIAMKLNLAGQDSAPLTTDPEEKS